MDEQIAQLQNDFRESQRKWNYFILGLLVALFAYLGKDFEAAPIGWTKNTFELASLILLAISILLNIYLVNLGIFVQQVNIEVLEIAKNIRDYRSASEEGRDQFELSSGEILTPEKVKDKSDEEVKEYMEFQSLIEKQYGKFLYVGRAHSVCVILAFLLLCLSRSIGLFSELLV